ncbi:MAG: VOC family protein [Planctomycetota bacterium]|nr:VOC family protein [Planctomycetota bacterium]
MSVQKITPQLRTTDLDRTIRFYTEKVGLQLEFRHADFYAGLRAPGGSFHLKRVDTPDPSIEFVDEGGHLHLYLSVEDVDAFGRRLREAGVDLVQPPCDTDWGTRELVFKDDQGHTIYAGMPRAAK